MAVVKFLSKQDCQVFIDMELAGKVTSDSMLKVTLETGGYLIQIKDEHGILIKEYEMEIKSSDNQLLQRVDGINNKLDDVIENLKNDSSVVFHCERASFCYNGLYGFVDKTFAVVIPPIYYCVNRFENNKAFVVRDFPEGRKTTMIDRDGKMFFNRWFDYIGEGESNVLLGIDDRIIVYSKVKYNKVAEYFNAGYDFKQPFIPVYIIESDEEVYGFINLNGDVVLPLVFDKVWNADNNMQAKFWYYGFIGNIDFRNSLISDVYGKKNKFGDTLFTDNDILLQGDVLDVEYNIGIFPCRKDGRWVIKEHHYSTNMSTGYEEVSETKEIECDRILYIGYNCYAYKLNGQCIVHYLFEEDDQVFNNSYIVPVIGNYEGVYISPNDLRFITRVRGKYGLIDKSNKVIIPISFNCIYWDDKTDFAILQKGEKYSIAELREGHIYLPFLYNQIIRKNTYNTDISCFILFQSNKYQLYIPSQNYITEEYDNLIACGPNNIVNKDCCYGIVDNCGKEIVPLKKHVIALVNDNHYNNDGWFFKISNNGLYSLGNAVTGEILTEQIYDDITMLCSGIDLFLVKKGNLYGCINVEGDVWLPIKYDKIEADSDFWFPFKSDYYVTLYDQKTILRYNLGEKRK